MSARIFELYRWYDHRHMAEGNAWWICIGSRLAFSIDSKSHIGSVRTGLDAQRIRSTLKSASSMWLRVEP